MKALGCILAICLAIDVAFVLLVCWAFGLIG